jgi:ornithine lipid ester-linked acyl 2-hydroxylase
LDATHREPSRSHAPSLIKRLMLSVDRFFVRHSLVPAGPFFTQEDFPWIHILEQSWREVRAELDGLMPRVADLPNFQDVSKDQANLTGGDSWKTYFFYVYGLKAARNCQRCPRTAKLLKRIPGLKTAYFSIFSPHTRLPLHRGAYKGVLRVHLALLVPEPRTACGLRVGSELKHWEEGEVLMFDDTFPHEAWNDTDKYRAVLLMDIARPSRFPANALNAVMMWAIALSPYVLGSAGSYLRWQRRFDRLATGKES